MHFVLKGTMILIFFISWKVFAACSPYTGDATINEIYKEAGENGDSFIEFNLLDNSIPSSVYKQWSIKICYEIETGKGKNKSKSNICDVIPVSEMDDATQWIWVSNPRVDRDYLDFNNGFDLSLLDNNDNFIDYIQVEGYSGQNFTSSCSYSGLNYVFNIPNSINGGTKILLRKPDGTGEWIESKSNSYPTSKGGTNNSITALDHYEIIHDGQGLTCDAETITIKACTNESCSTESTESISLDLLGNGTLKSSVTFTGTTTVNVNHTAVGTLTFSLNNETIAPDNLLICDDGSSDNCDMTFTTAGFRFLSGAGSSTTIPNQIAGSVFSDSLKLQAVKDTNGVCTGIFDGNTAVDLSQENVDPGGTNGLSFSIGGSPIAKHSSTTSTTISFGTNSIATLSSPIYHDAGQIRLRANYSVGGVTLTGSSNAFWVSPAELIISAKSGTTNLNGATATATPTHAAGEDFTLKVSAYNAATPAVVTPNYSPGQIQVKLTRTGPTFIDQNADGSLTYAASSTLASDISPSFNDASLTSFVSGESIYTTAQYSEVGLLNLDAQDSNYGNANIVVPATAINIGRFIPDHFKQTIVNSGSFFSTCNTGTTFAYSGQKDEATDSIGAISYPISPVLLITAYNKQGDITRNYYEDSQGSTNDYMKLNAAGVSVSAPTTDQVKTGVNGDKLPFTANMNTGTLSQNDLTTSIPSDNPLAKGELHYQFSDDDHFFYNRSANAVVTPFSSDITFSIATIIDADNVNVTTTEVASPTGIEIRFGRLVLKNSFGPETSNLPQQMQIEHFDGTDFVVSSDNDCVGYDASKISLTNVSLDPALTDKLGGTGNFIEGKTQAIELEATGDGNRGSIGVSYDTYDWLKYDWSGNDIYNEDPSAVATFGLYRGNDRIIYTREIF